MSTMADFIDLGHGEQYMPRFASRNCYFKLLFRYEEENVQWLANRFLGTSQGTRGGAWICW